MKTSVAIAIASLLAASAARAQPTVDDQALDAARGGFIVAGDIAFNFGAVMRTYADGELALQTTVRWTDAGQVVETLAPAGLANVAPGSILQSVQPGQFANILLNTDSGRQFRQETDITLTLPGFAATQSDFGRDMMARRLSDDLAIAQVGAIN
jgi:hypothetical protein